MHCYRMLGSLQDAEDALQDTLLAAWQGLAGFEGRASLRTWLYRIATNRCLNARRSAGRRPPEAWNVPGVDPPEPTRLGRGGLARSPSPTPSERDVPLGPEARYEQTESISLAFVTALQMLPPRQVAVLVLRDVLGFPAGEVAEMLDTTVDSVTSALKRARAGLQRRRPRATGRRRRLARRGRGRGEVRRRVRVRRPRRARRAADRRRVRLDAADAVRVRRPRRRRPRFFARIFGAGRRFDLVPTRANGQPAFGAYLRGADGVRHGVGPDRAGRSRGDRISAHDPLREHACCRGSGCRGRCLRGASDPQRAEPSARPSA